MGLSDIGEVVSSVSKSVVLFLAISLFDFLS